MDRTQANSGTRGVAQALRFDEAALEAWMRGHVAGFRGPVRVSQFRGGQSNPTYRIDTAGQAFVLRRKPPGKLLPGAHAIDREYRVLEALGRAGFPVPLVHALCEDAGVIGTPFYLMDMVEGRIFWEARLPGVERDARAAHFDAMNAAIAALHAFDPAAIGLGDYGAARRLRRAAGGALVKTICRRCRRRTGRDDGPAGGVAGTQPARRQRPLERRPRRFSLRQHDF